MNKCPYDMQFGIHWNYSRKCIECKLWKKCMNKFKELFLIDGNKNWWLEGNAGIDIQTLLKMGNNKDEKGFIK